MRRKVCISASQNFYKRMELERERLQKQSGLKNISQTKMTELIARNFPKIKLTEVQLKDAKRKKRLSC